MLAVSDHSMSTIREAQIALSRWDIQGAVNVTARDRSVISNAVLLGKELHHPARHSETGKPTVNSLNPSSRSWVWKQLFDWAELSNVVVTPSVPIVPQNPSWVLPTTGDLTKVPLGLVRTNLADLNRAATALQIRCQTLIHLMLTSSVKPADVEMVMPRLTSAERANFGSLLRINMARDGVAYFGAPVIDLLALLMSVAAIGACGRALASLGLYLGTGKFKMRWTAFYLFRPVEGAVLAAGFYFIISGGLWSLPSLQAQNNPPAATETTALIATPPPPTSATNSPTSGSSQPGGGLPQGAATGTFAFCALAFIIGMFSDEATQKLAKIATAIFTDNTRQDSIEDTAPRIIATYAVPLFSLESITNLSEFALKLKDATDSVSQFLLADSRFAQVALVLKNTGASQINDQDVPLKHALVNGLNGVIQAGPVFNETRFKNIKCAPQTDELRLKNPTGLDLVLLNRWLLLDVYSPDPPAPPSPPCLSAQTTRWLVEIDGTAFTPQTTVFVEQAKLSPASNLAFVNKETMRFEYQQDKPQTRQSITVLASNPPAAGSSADAAGGHSENVKVTLDTAIDQSKAPAA